MNHNEFDLERDLIWPMSNFLQGNDIEWTVGQVNIMNSFVRNHEEAIRHENNLYIERAKRVSQANHVNS